MKIPENINEDFLKSETTRLNEALFEIFTKSITEYYISSHAKE